MVALPDGVRLAVHERGAGTPVLLLHAWGETHRSFDRLVPLLPDDWRVVVPDQRGVGDSDRPPTGYRLAEAAADVVGLLDGLGLPAAWLVGTSSGGYVAQRVGVDHPDRLLGMVLVGAPSSLAGRDPFGAALAAFDDPVTPDDVASVMSALSMSAPIPHDFRAAQDVAALTIPRHVWVAGYRGLVEAVPPTRDGVVRVPTLLLTGADDDLLGPEDAAALQAAIPGSRERVYPGTGHLVLWERPEWVARDLVAFVGARAGGQPGR